MSRKRKILSTVFIIILLCAGFLFYLKFYYPNNQDTALQRLKIFLFDENNITVEGDGVKISDDGIKVIWSSEVVKGKVIWENEEQVGSIENVYGPQTFSVYYYNRLVGTAYHLETSNWHTHDYTIKLHFLDANHTVGFDFNAEGPDRLTLKTIHI